MGVSEVNSKTTLYACFVKEENNKDEDIVNPTTGSVLLYLAYLIGILALVYTGYYSYKAVKSKK